MFQNKTITCRAAVVWSKGEKAKIEDIQVDPPKKGEIRIKIVATGVCHSDLSAANGIIVGSNFPVVLGHEGAGIVESVGEDVSSFQVGDHVVPLFLPQCKQCVICDHETANFCLQFTGHQIKGLMSDGTSRLSCRGEKIFHFLACSTFSEYSVCTVGNLSKVNVKAPLEKICLFSCGVSTGYGAAINTAKVKSGSSCAVWGLGALGLAAIHGCKNSGASRIIAIDINPDKFEIAKKLGATECINPKEIEIPIQEHLRTISGGLGIDYTFEAIGSVAVMRQAFESAAIGYGVCVLIGVVPEGHEISVNPTDLQFGRTLKGTFFGCYKSVDSVPKLVDEYLEGKIEIDCFITHEMQLEQINEAFDLMVQSKSIRSVIKMH